MWNANGVTFCVLAQAYGSCSGLMGYHAMSSAYSQWPVNVPSTTTTVPQEVQGNWRALKDAEVCK